MNTRKAQIKFIVKPFQRYLTPEINTCFLLNDNWNDFGFNTTFLLHFYDENGLEKKLGYIKIMVKDQVQGRTPMPQGYFSQLDSNYCSLGATQGYYEEFMGLDEDIRASILISLRDCAYNRNIYTENKDEEAMRSSLFRGANTTKAIIFFSNILRGIAEPTSYHFQFLIRGEDNLKIDIKVTPDSTPSTNIHVLIGRNGVGKTRILSGLADELTKNKHFELSDRSVSEMSQEGTLKFIDSFSNDDTEGHEKFSNLVTVAFSAFDNFKPIRSQKDQYFFENYIGLKYINDKEEVSFISPEKLTDNFLESVKICLNTQRKKRWIEAIKILNLDSIFREYNLDKIVDMPDKIPALRKIFNRLSSGHRIVLLSITRLVELVDEKTIVLIDEPETHLHPPLLSSFMGAISDLLIKRNAVAIIATHSPIVLQEVPKSCVTKINRVRSEYDLHKPTIETYGENIDVLTRDIFGLEMEASGFCKTIRDYSKSKESTYDSLIADFNNSIGSEGRAIARSIFHNKEIDHA